MLRKLFYSVVGLALLATGAVGATNLVLSTGGAFIPGFRLVDGDDLNKVLTALEVVRDQADGTTAGTYKGVYNGTVGATTPAAGAFTTVAASTSATVTSASANALSVGVTGATAPTFNVDASVASNVTGLQVQGQATTAGVFVTALGSTNEPVFLAGKGTGPVYLGGTTTTLAGLQIAQTASRVNNIVITPAATGTAAVISEGGAGSDANRDLNVAAAGTGIVTLGQARATCSGTTTSTCQGQRFISSVTGLTTAASTLSATMTVTNASVVSAASIVHCQVNIYAGTGVPVVVNVTPGTGSVAFGIQNVSTGAALNATVPVACVVF